jgi:Flp pilus assembly protein TadD
VLRAALLHHPADFGLHSTLGGSVDDPGEAIGGYRAALALQPNNARIHNNLGFALRKKKAPDGSMRHLRKAVELDPNNAVAWNNLGVVLAEQNDADGAIAHYRTAIDVNPKDLAAHYNPGIALSDKRDFEGAIEHYHKAIAIDATHAESHCNLGTALILSGKPVEALQSIQKGDALGSKQPGWKYPSANWVKICERIIEIDRQVPEVLRGERKPATLRGWLDYVEICQSKKDTIAAAKLWELAFKEESRREGALTAKEKRQTHDVKLRAGMTYVIDLESNAFDAYLILEDAQGKKLADNDDINPGTFNSRLTFTAPKDGVYRLTAAAFQGPSIGAYVLYVRMFIAGPKAPR